MGAVVEISSGKLKGIEEGGVIAFKGIPFAAPPVGALRWQAPEPVERWQGVRDASAFGNSAMQTPLPSAIGELIGIATGATSEDCLYLNVWTPALDGAARPVMAWIHGGGNTVGSGSQPRFDGSHLARVGDVVVVTINYRLGAFGFLHAPEIGASGNEALLDQIAGLRWIRSEIEAFGGDRGNVTVFGQSAGGFDIAQLMGMRQAEGCFDRMIPMSGSLTAQVPAAEALTTSARFAGKFGGTAGLKRASAEEILAFQGELTGARFGPVLDGKVITSDAANQIGEGTYTRGLPLMIGSCRDESTLFTMGSEAMANMDEPRLVQLAAGAFGDRATEAVACYRRVRERRKLDTAPASIWAAIATDRMFGQPAVRTAELHAGHTPETWVYQFNYESPAWEGRLKSCHSLDIPFIWGTYDIPSMREFCGTGPEARELSERMMATYLAFARSGDPNHEGVPEWPRYDTESRTTMELGLECRATEGLNEEIRLLWQESAR